MVSRRNVNTVIKKFSLFGVRRPAGGAWDALMKYIRDAKVVIAHQKTRLIFLK